MAMAMMAAAGPSGSSLQGTRICTTGVTGDARDALFALVRLHGGTCAAQLDRRCTHLILRGVPADAAGERYPYARRHRIHTVAASFLQDCIESGRRAREAGHAICGAAEYDVLSDSSDSDEESGAAEDESSSRFLHGHRAVVHLGRSLEPVARELLAHEVRAAGGAVRHAYFCRGGCTHVLCARRDDPAYELAAADHTPVVTAVWWQDCLAQRALVQTEELFYRPPGGGADGRGVAGMAAVRLTVTGLSGNRRREARELLQLLGGEFSGALRRPKPASSGGNSNGADSGSTHLICEVGSGAKYIKAMQWGVKVVRAAWLQDCFRQWQMLPEDDYILPAAASDAAAVASIGGGTKRPASALAIADAGTAPGTNVGDESLRKVKRVAQQHADVHRAPAAEAAIGFRFAVSGSKAHRRALTVQIAEVDRELQQASPPLPASEHGVLLPDLPKGRPRSGSSGSGQQTGEGGSGVTHLIMVSLKRTEKFLVAVASGAWVLRPSFLAEAARRRSFSAVDAAKHEWAGEGVLPIPNSSGIWLGAPRYWRLQHLKQQGRRPGPFFGMSVRVHGTTMMRSALQRMVVAGRASSCVMPDSQQTEQEENQAQDDAASTHSQSRASSSTSDSVRSQRSDDAAAVVSGTVAETSEVHVALIGHAGLEPAQRQRLLREWGSRGVPCVRECWVVDRICVDPRADPCDPKYAASGP